MSDFLTSLPQVVLQDIKKSFEGIHFDANINFKLQLPHYEIPYTIDQASKIVFKFRKCQIFDSPAYNNTRYPKRQEG